ncbi:MAG: hypothetical protein WBQ72_14565 [Terriglobales bacterium]
MRRPAVISALAVMAFAGFWLGAALHAQELTQHLERKQVDKGPRALGLVQVSKSGKARMIPIAIMMNGKFFDAGAYKADPVPMALDFGIVYEAFRAGVSEGLFTITQPGQLNRAWIAEGTWLPAGVKPPETTHKYSAPVIDEGEKDDRPVLHRRTGGEADKDETKPAANSGTGSPPTTPTSSTTTSSPSSTGKDSSQSTPPANSAPPNSASANSTASGGNKTADAGASKTAEANSAKRSEYEQPPNDPNRPILRRGKPDPNLHHEPFVDFDETDVAEAGKNAGASAAGADKNTGKDATTVPAPVLTVVAISDAAGPDPRPYTYDLKPAEEAIYRNKMLDLAAEQLRRSAHSSSNSPNTNAASAKTSATAHKKTADAKAAKPQFEDVKLRIFDLSNSNEPVLVLSARTPVPAAGSPGSQLPQEITLIARTNLEGELLKLFFAQTDSRHLDMRPRMELIDAVDADGDGRGELLFRRIFDSGSAYAIYRVAADQLWPLYEPTP